MKTSDIIFTEREVSTRELEITGEVRNYIRMKIDKVLVQRDNYPVWKTQMTHALAHGVFFSDHPSKILEEARYIIHDLRALLHQAYIYDGKKLTVDAVERADRFMIATMEGNDADTYRRHI